MTETDLLLASSVASLAPPISRLLILVGSFRRHISQYVERFTRVARDASFLTWFRDEMTFVSRRLTSYLFPSASGALKRAPRATLARCVDAHVVHSLRFWLKGRVNDPLK